MIRSGYRTLSATYFVDTQHIKWGEKQEKKKDKTKSRYGQDTTREAPAIFLTHKTHTLHATHMHITIHIHSYTHADTCILTYYTHDTSTHTHTANIVK